MKKVYKGHNSNFRSSEFKDVLFNKKIVSKNHKIYTQDIKSITSLIKGKRFIL